MQIKTNNSTAYGIMNKTIKRKRSKSFDMKFWWLVDRVEQGHFIVYWAPGILSLADYFTKRHPPSHHRMLRAIYLYIEGISPNSQLGCIEILKRALLPKHARNNNIDSLDGQNTGRAQNNHQSPKAITAATTRARLSKIVTS